MSDTEQVAVPTSITVDGEDVEALVALLDWLDIEHPQECPEGCGCSRTRLRRLLAGDERGPCICRHFDILADSLAGVVDPPPNPNCAYHGITA